MQSESERFLELVNLTADNEASPEQRAELQKLLDLSPEAAEAEARTRELVSRLDATPQVDPPAGLRSGIMQRVRDLAPRNNVPVFPRRRRFALAWSAAAAVVLAILLFVPGRVGDHTGAVMAPTSEWRVVTRSSEERLTLVVRQKSELYRIEPSITGPYPARVTLSWDPGAAVVVATRGVPEASSAAHPIELTVRGAEDRAFVIIRPARGAPFMVRVAVDGSEVLRTTVPVQ